MNHEDATPVGENKEGRYSAEEVQEMIKAGIADALKSERDKLKAEKEAFERERTEKQRDYNKLMKSSNQPWINIESGNPDEADADKGIPIELEWNDAMIKYLKQSGVPGITEDEIIQTWLNAVYRDMGATEELENPEVGDYT